jgi:Fic family protein
MGRFWQTVFLARMRPLLGMIPIEALLKERQQGYYEMIEAADRSGDSTGFVEFMLAAIHDALAGAVPQLMLRARPEDRLQLAVMEGDAPTCSLHEFKEKTSPLI